MRARIAWVLAAVCAALPLAPADTTALLTSTKVGPTVSVTAWTGCLANRYRDAVLATSPQAYLRMAPVGLTESSLGSVSTAWTWTAAPASVTGALTCDPNPASVLTSAAWLSSEHAVFVAADSAPFSYALWFKAAAGSNGVLFASTAGAAASGATSRADRVLWIAPSGVLAVAVTDGPVTRWITSPAAVTDGSWHFAVVTLQPNDLGSVRGTRLYLDGAMIGYNQQMRKGLPPTSTESWRAGPAAVSADVGALAPTTAFTGAVDEVAVWPVVLTDAQISGLWQVRSG